MYQLEAISLNENILEIKYSQYLLDYFVSNYLIFKFFFFLHTIINKIILSKNI